MKALFVALALLATSCTGTPVADETQLARVIRVLDGDTIVVMDDGRETEVRLIGINTPEQGECFDAEARTATQQLVGDSVRLTGSKTDRFGRLLGYVYDSAGTLVNRELLANGFALAFSTGHELSAEFKQAEEGAFDARLGRWRPDVCGPPSGGNPVISGLEPNAPGDDTANPNGEWLEVTNRGSAGLDLEGWVIQDESSQHRFVFPAGYVLDRGVTVRVFSGTGINEPTRLYWAADGPVWSNDGDTAYLLDRTGNVRDRWAFRLQG